MRTLRHLLVAARLGVVLGICAAAPGWADCPQFDDAAAHGSVQSGVILEASGMVASRKNPGVLWVHNDSGDSARVFAMGTDGSDWGTFNIVGITARDWEDIALGPGPILGEDYLYIGDIGDNDGLYNSIVVQRVLEPNVIPGPGAVDVYGADSIELVYPSAEKMDAETLLVDPVNGDLYIISKREMPCRIFRAAYPQSTTTTTTLEYLGYLSLPNGYGWAVGSDISHLTGIASSSAVESATGQSTFNIRQPFGLDPTVQALLTCSPRTGARYHWRWNPRAKRSASISTAAAISRSAKGQHSRCTVIEGLGRETLTRIATSTCRTLRRSLNAGRSALEPETVP